MSLADALKSFDERIDQSLTEAYLEIEKKSKALANSLKRCFDEARTSVRFEKAYQLGLNGEYPNLSEEEIIKKLVEDFETIDFEIFREFVRLLRACSLHIGGNISAPIRDAYNKTFKEDRLILAFREGLKSRDCARNIPEIF